MSPKKKKKNDKHKERFLFIVAADSFKKPLGTLILFCVNSIISAWTWTRKDEMRFNSTGLEHISSAYPQKRRSVRQRSGEREGKFRRFVSSGTLEILRRVQWECVYIESRGVDSNQILPGICSLFLVCVKKKHKPGWNVALTLHRNWMNSRNAPVLLYFRSSVVVGVKSKKIDSVNQQL